MQDFRKLKVWEKAHSLALSIYRVTEAFPKNEVLRTDQPDPPVLDLNPVEHR